MKALSYLIALAAGTYIADVPLRRRSAAEAARRFAAAQGKPLLNVGAGTGQTALFGATLYGDVNIDLNGRKDVPHGTPGVVTYADAQDLRDFKDGHFGAVLASHILEHLPNPEKALSEWRRVAGGTNASLFVVTPKWWAPHTWVHPGHLWYFTDGAGGTRGGKTRPLRKSFPKSLKWLPLRGVE